jgi:hypothetical protein
MTDNLYDGEFHVPFPSWVLVKKSCIAKSGDGTARFTKDPVWLMVTDDKGEESVPVFTDEDTALSFCVASALEDEAEMIAAEDAQHLAKMLELIKGLHDASYVVFDPKKPIGASPRVYPIDYAVKRLMKGLNL